VSLLSRLRRAHGRPRRFAEPPASPHPGQTCGPDCDITDAAHHFGGVFITTGPVLPQPPRDDHAPPILPQVAGPAPKPCCDWYLDTAGWAHGADCTLQPALERFPLAGPRQPLVTQPGSRWGYLNKGASCG
jgi:hypothetical protein